MNNGKILYTLSNKRNKVVEYTDLFGQKIRVLKNENSIYSVSIVNSNAFYYSYLELYDFPVRLNKKCKNFLMLGAGCFTYPKYYISKYKDKKMDAIEIDKEIIAISYKYFDLDKLYNDYDKNKKRLKIFNEDAYKYVKNCNKLYDVIFQDLFINNEPIKKFLSLDFIKKLKRF